MCPTVTKSWEVQPSGRDSRKRGKETLRFVKIGICCSEHPPSRGRGVLRVILSNAVFGL